MGNDNQQQFISWLAQKLKVKDQNEFKSKLKSLGDDGIKQAYDEFLKVQSQQVTAAKDGAKLEYLKCLKEFKKGGKMAKDCGCGGKMEKGGKLKDKAKPGVPWFLSKHQAGGLIGKEFFADTNIVPEVKIKSTRLTKTQPFLALAPSEMGAKQISQAHYAHLQQVVPNFNKLVPAPFQKDGEVPRFGPEQSDIIRQLIGKYPMPKPAVATQQAAPAQTGQLATAFQEGGPIGDGAYKFKTSKEAKKLTPHKVKMGQGAGTVTSR